MQTLLFLSICCVTAAAPSLSVSEQAAAEEIERKLQNANATLQSELGVLVSGGSVIEDLRQLDKYRKVPALAGRMYAVDLALGETYFRMGNDAMALPRLERVAQHITEDLGDNKGTRAFRSVAVHWLSRLALRRGEFSKAETLADESDKLFADTSSAAIPRNQAVRLRDRAALSHAIGDDERASTYLHEALRLVSAEKDNEQLQGELYYALASLAKDQGDYEQAIVWYDKANALEKFQGLRRANEGRLDCLIEQGKYQDAGALMNEFARLGIYTDLRAGGKLLLYDEAWSKAIRYWENYLRETESIRDEQIFVAQTGLGRAYLGAGQPDKAREQFGRAIERVESQRERVELNRRGRFFSTKIWGFKRTDPFEGIVSAELLSGRTSAAFIASEGIKSRVLAEVLARSASPESAGGPLVQEERTLAEARVALARSIDSAYRADDKVALEALAKKQAALKNDEKRFVEKLRRENPAYAAARYPSPVAPAEVTLTPGEALVSFEVTADATHVFLLHNRKLQVRKIAVSRVDLEQKIRAYRAFFDGVTKVDDLAAFSPAAGKELFDWLLAPEWKALLEERKPTKLIIVPDELLAILPFEALVVGMQGQKVAEGEFGPFPLGVTYLTDLVPITYASSATVLTLTRALKRREPQSRTMLVAADPVFSAADPRADPSIATGSTQFGGYAQRIRTMGVAGTRSRAEAASGARAATTEVFPRLDKTGRLAERLVKLYGAGARALTGLSANVLNLTSSDLQGQSALVFATHGILDNAVPGVNEPALVLSRTPNARGSDNFLRASDIARMTLSADVVALTACQTGVGKQVAGEGVQGLGRAFQMAGAKNVMMSLWSVAEDSSSELTEAFFQSIVAGQTADVAMHTARQAVRKKGYEHPFYWAAFVLMGQ
jgi:CHAT domain-containing protein